MCGKPDEKKQKSKRPQSMQIDKTPKHDVAHGRRASDSSARHRSDTESSGTASGQNTPKFNDVKYDNLRPRTARRNSQALNPSAESSFVGSKIVEQGSDSSSQSGYLESETSGSTPKRRSSIYMGDAIGQESVGDYAGLGAAHVSSDSGSTVKDFHQKKSIQPDGPKLLTTQNLSAFSNDALRKD